MDVENKTVRRELKSNLKILQKQFTSEKPNQLHCTHSDSLTASTTTCDRIQLAAMKIQPLTLLWTRTPPKTDDWDPIMSLNKHTSKAAAGGNEVGFSSWGLGGHLLVKINPAPLPLLS